MKIGIDARWIMEESSGIGQYTLNLLRFLSQADSRDLYFIFFSNRELLKTIDRDLGLTVKGNFYIILVPYGVFSLRNQIFLPVKLRRLRLDVFHSTNFMIPLAAFGVKLAVTIHDLIPLLFPEFAPRSRKSRFYVVYCLLMYTIIKRVRLILVDSQNSYQDMVRRFP